MGKPDTPEYFGEDNTPFQGWTSFEAPKKKEKEKPKKFENIREALYTNVDSICEKFKDRIPTTEELRGIYQFLTRTVGRHPEKQVSSLMSKLARLEGISEGDQRYRALQEEINKAAERFALKASRDALATELWIEALTTHGKMDEAQAEEYVMNIHRADALTFKIETIRRKQTQASLSKAAEDSAEDILGTA